MCAGSALGAVNRSGISRRVVERITSVGSHANSSSTEAKDSRASHVLGDLDRPCMKYFDTTVYPLRAPSRVIASQTRNLNFERYFSILSGYTKERREEKEDPARGNIAGRSLTCARQCQPDLIEV